MFWRSIVLVITSSGNLQQRDFQRWRNLGLSPNCEMCVRVTNAAPAGHLVRLTAGIAGSEVTCCGPTSRIVGDEKENEDVNPGPEFWGSVASAVLFTAPFFTWFSNTFPFQICESYAYPFPLRCQSRYKVVRLNLTKMGIISKLRKGKNHG